VCVLVRVRLDKKDRHPGIFAGRALPFEVVALLRWPVIFESSHDDLLTP